MSKLDLKHTETIIKELSEKRRDLEDKKLEIKFQLDKVNDELDELKDRIQEVFGTTDIPTLEDKLQKLTAKAEQLLQELEADEM